MWGEGGYPPHPYLVEPGRPGSVPMHGAEAEAARQARDAATVLGSGLVDQRLQEAARFGGERQAQEAAWAAAAEAHFVMDQSRRAAWAAASRVAAIPTSPVAAPARPSRTEVVVGPSSPTKPVQQKPVKTAVKKLVQQSAPALELQDPPSRMITDQLYEKCYRLERVMREKTWTACATFMPIYSSVLLLGLVMEEISATAFLIMVPLGLVILVAASICFYWRDYEE